MCLLSMISCAVVEDKAPGRRKSLEVIAHQKVFMKGLWSLLPMGEYSEAK